MLPWNSLGHVNHRPLTAIFVDMPSTDSLTVRATLFSFGFLNMYRSTVMDTSPEGGRVLRFMRLCRYWPNQRPTMALVPLRLPFLDLTIVVLTLNGCCVLCVPPLLFLAAVLTLSTTWRLLDLFGTQLHSKCCFLDSICLFFCSLLC